ncbi:MAG TPA: YicC family protein [Syntrophorhabdaceae bacterium]|nr:YicC family protein [Syntrophorhabdaceae bacterium]HQM80020.1 YicC family protein [Syntrophorhabdaceae bacterium]
MPKSMTGFAKLETESTDGKLYGEARALNSRYLEISIKLPRADFLHEQKLRELVKRHIKRGKVDITIKWERPNEQAGAQKINENVLAQYVETAKTLKEKYALKGDLTIDNIFSFKDIFSYEENNNINEDMLMQSFEKLIAQLNQEREKEGDLIKKDLMARADAIVSNVAAIEERWPLTIKMLENRLRERITEIITSSSVDETRVLQELAIYMERLDIAEEIVRLKGHIENFSDTLSSDDPIGRKLDFIIQEMVRESNTIGSKANDLFINERIIQIKVEIEKMREQVQNVE